MGQNEVQAGKITKFGNKERESEHQNEIQNQMRSHPNSHRRTCEKSGEMVYTSLKDTESITQMVIQGEEWMRKIDRSGLPGKYKAWCYQHGVLPRLLWPLMIYDEPLTIVEKMERKISGHLTLYSALYTFVYTKSNTSLHSIQHAHNISYLLYQ